MKIKVYEFFKPVFVIMVEEQGLNVSTAADGLTNETVYFEIEECTKILIETKGVHIHQGNNKFYFDRSFYSKIEI